MKAKVVYLVVFALVLVSWAGNYAYHRASQLPEAGFLRHNIETSYIPSVAFDLLYIANKNDKRKLVSARVDELPALRFFLIQTHQEMRHQTLYLLRGHYEESLIESREALAPITIHKIMAQFSDGTESEEDIGEIIVYRDDAWPIHAEKSPIQMSSTSGSSDHKGSVTVRITRPLTLTGVSSRWLEKLGDSFHYETVPKSNRGLPSEGTEAPPVTVKRGQSLTLNYQFRIPRESKQAMEVYNLLLRENFKEPDGQDVSYTVFAHYLPYPTESQMRAYVREKRRQAK
ncbi:hypothetical protein [Cohnella luojiensis]|uniref:Uncharacterized protein n=1 Tax=Cohnella luojiensis TaxID=652876 RepID=A0A4Y8M503_9BACL|nr:hypothetical protein [Cohnella luojiensis]TFE29451.1 hypothetical protein E2980_05495 [Cohnella luojiensis]